MSERSETPSPALSSAPRAYCAPLALAFIAFACAPLAAGCKDKSKDKRRGSGAPAVAPLDGAAVFRQRSLGLAHLEEQRLDEAKAAFAALIQLAPDEPLGHANLALAHLRLGDAEAAISHAERARALAPRDADVALILARAQLHAGRRGDAEATLRAAVAAEPGHARSLLALSELLGFRDGDAAARREPREVVARAIEAAPDALLLRGQYAELLARAVRDAAGADIDGEDVRASRRALIGALESIRAQIGPLTPQIDDALAAAIDAAARQPDGDPAAAVTAVRVLHNLLKPLPAYQAGVTALVGVENEGVGFPLRSLSPATLARVERDRSGGAAIAFVDATADAFGDAVAQVSGSRTGDAERRAGLAMADLDGDGDLDLAAAIDGRLHLYARDTGRFIDVRESWLSGKKDFENQLLSGVDRGLDDVIVGDYDGDGFPDLFAVADGRVHALRNLDGRGFADATAEALGPLATTGATGATVHQALLVDLDHDGDLDLWLARDGADAFWRNNGAGGFVDGTADTGLGGADGEPPGRADARVGSAPTRRGRFGDYDDDGDLDLLIDVRGDGEAGGLWIWDNLRQGRFRAVPAAEVFSGVGGRLLDVADADNDGRLDALVAGERGARWIRAAGAPWTLAPLGRDAIADAAVADYDNDGWLDVAAVTAAGQVRVVLGGPDGAVDDSVRAPDSPPRSFKRDDHATAAIAAEDVDADGDMDVLLADAGGLRLLRNDGGDARAYLRVRLRGLAVGSGKTSRAGIGATIEVKAGVHYQRRQVRGEVTHFGLGAHAVADVVRVVWPNGAPQNRVDVRSDQWVIEEQKLKGSCPFLYVWDGERFQFATDVHWRSALGMPLGIMGSAFTYAFADSTREHFKIPAGLAAVDGGAYRLSFTEELWETAYVDHVELVAVDHPADASVYVDERFVPPPYPPFRVWAIADADLRRPRATDERGRDVSARLADADGVYAGGMRPTRYQGITELHDLILDVEPGAPGDPGATDAALVLLLTGWLLPTDASLNVAIAHNPRVHVAPPRLDVRQPDGSWRTLRANIGFPAGKDKTLVVDLSGALPPRPTQVRIRTNMQIYWDRAVYATRTLDPTRVAIARIPIARATLRHRGFSRLRRAGPWSPSRPDYADVTRVPAWPSLAGRYTAYGDVTALLAAADDDYAIVDTGDEIAMRFAADALPPLSAGWTRDLIFYSDGWLKDGDLNTATGQTVAPLPHRDMTAFPPPDGDGAPATSGASGRYRDGRRFRRLIIDGP